MKLSYICIMAGGSGERFWPVSRLSKPKHLVQLLGQETLLEAAVRRALNLVPMENLFILTSGFQLERCRTLLPHLPARQFVVEPAKRDTAAACTLGTALVHRQDPGALVAFFPADALIKTEAVFAEQLLAAATWAGRYNSIATLGIVPHAPLTRFGYIKKGEPLDHSTEFFQVEKFVEKPSVSVAKRYLAEGNYLWNAGVFVWRTTTFLAEARRQQPELADFIEEFPGKEVDPGAYIKAQFPLLPKKAVDYAIMEQAYRVIVTESRFDWDDIGSWTALPAHLPLDDEANTLLGSALFLQSRNNIVLNKTKRVVALCGVEDLIVVETEDALLICHRHAAEQVKLLQPLLPDEVR